MDILERIGNPHLALKDALDGRQSEIWTAIPGIYQGPGIGQGTANVQPAVMGRITSPNRTTKDVALPLCLNCPILWPGGGGFLLTFPLQAGVSEGLLVFSSRGIDAWWLQGGVQPQIDLRQHDLSDGFFLPSPCGQKTAPTVAPSTNSVQIRTADGSKFIEVSAAGIQITGDVTVTGKITATGDVTAKQGGSSVTLSTHKHTANNTPPTPGT